MPQKQFQIYYFWGQIFKSGVEYSENKCNIVAELDFENYYFFKTPFIIGLIYKVDLIMEMISHFEKTKLNCCSVINQNLKFLRQGHSQSFC